MVRVWYIIFSKKYFHIWLTWFVKIVFFPTSSREKLLLKLVAQRTLKLGVFEFLEVRYHTIAGF